MDKDIRTYISTCPYCQKFKAPKEAVKGLLQTVFIEAPNIWVSIDLAGHYSVKQGVPRYLLTIMVDVYSGFAEAKAVHSLDASDVIQGLKHL